MAVTINLGNAERTQMSSIQTGSDHDHRYDKSMTGTVMSLKQKTRQTCQKLFHRYPLSALHSHKNAHAHTFIRAQNGTRTKTHNFRIHKYKSRPNPLHTCTHAQSHPLEHGIHTIIYQTKDSSSKCRSTIAHAHMHVRAHLHTHRAHAPKFPTISRSIVHI